MNKIKRTTITVSREWEEAVEKAKSMEIPMSQVVKALVKAWVEGEIHVTVQKLSITQAGEIIIVEKPSTEPECCAGQCVGGGDCCVGEG